MKKKRRFITWVSIICTVVPRFFVSYVFYLLPSLISVKFTYRKFIYLFLTAFVLFMAWLFSCLVANISITSFLLAFGLQLPFIFFLLGFDLKDGINGVLIMRVISVLLCIFSLIYMAMFYGFPFRLPYINFLPDFYSAFYFQGGARIITVIAVFALAMELFLPKKRKNKFFLFIALLNFLVPNYLIGIIMGVGALGVVALRKKPAIIPLLLIIVLIVAPYAADRYQNLNNGFAVNTGMNPKVFAYYSVLQLYIQYPTTILWGTGLGAFSSTPALWASSYISTLSTHNIPKLPYFFMSAYHQAVLGPVLKVLVTNKWTLESSANKPYTSISSIFTEYGLVFTVIIIVLAYNAFKAMGWSKKYTIAIACFALFIFITDQWHDSLFFGYMLLLSKGISVETV
jgi:hypothetical protein